MMEVELGEGWILHKHCKVCMSPNKHLFFFLINSYMII